ncbi:MAG: transposase [Chloroflexota bacterium]|nr:transposase [Chloroflexota bacterium]
MLGPPKPRRLDEPVAASLEALVPRDHFYRHLEAKLDLSFVRDWARGLYAERGRPSIDPVVFFKLQLVMFFEGIRSERQLVATVSSSPLYGHDLQRSVALPRQSLHQGR